MSHQPERSEKECLNCGATVYGRYCHQCSQENIVPHQSFLSLAKHFVYDIFHFDGKFFDTLRFLIFRPGYVAREFIQGKRVRFLDPIRMYLFTSAVFFIIFSSLNPGIDFNRNDYLLLDRAERMELAMVLSAKSRLSPHDTILHYQLSQVLDSTKEIELKTYGDKSNSRLVSFRGKQFYLNAEKDSIDTNTNWFQQKIAYGANKFKAKYKDDYDAGANKLFNTFLHRVPYLLFVSLPFFAGLLRFLYKKKTSLFYSDHAVFSIYHYILSFILLLLIIGFNSLLSLTGWSLFNWIIFLLVVAWPLHLFLGLKNFYGHGFGKTFANFLALNILGSMLLAILFILFALISFEV